MSQKKMQQEATCLRTPSELCGANKENKSGLFGRALRYHGMVTEREGTFKTRFWKKAPPQMQD